MFYSHEILTSREHGVATVWLVATLGAKSAARKVNRRAILDVDVPKACETIIRPEAPMALRLQGNLLYGVSRVYHQQCGYALMDAQAMRDKMQAMLREIRSTGLDPSAGKAKPSQLVLPDDPSFIPDLMLPGLNVDLSVLDISLDIGSPRKSSLLSSVLAPSSKSSQFSDGQLQLNISSSDIGGHGAGASGFPSDIGSSVRKEAQFELPAAFAEETGVLLQPDFEFDGDGNIVELPVNPTPKDKCIAVSGRSATNVNSRLRTEEEAEYQAFQDQFQDQMVLHDDVEIRDGGHSNFGSGDPVSILDSAADPNFEPVVEASSEAPEVEQRLRKRTIKTLGFDDPPELRNSDLAQWNSDYAQNMALATKLKQNNRLITLAKKNAVSWVMGDRICCVDIGLGVSDFEHPLDIFSGEQLLAALTGTKIRTTRRKRSWDEDKCADSGDEERNVRMRGAAEDEIGSGYAAEHDDGYGIGFEDIEVGRHAPLPIYDDASSQMPWNITASIRGSQPGSSIHSRQFLPSVGGYSSIGGPRSIASGGGHDGSVMGGPSTTALGRRMGRMTSASPLAGRGMMGPGMGDISIMDDGEFDIRSNLGDNMDLDSSVTGRGELASTRSHHHDSFELYGPSAAVDTQTAAESQWLAATLDQESANFLDFVKSKIGEAGEKKVNAPAAAAGTVESGGHENDHDNAIAPTTTVEISFSTLLPSTVNSRIVATQALLHTLTLATKGALHVRQEKGIRSEDGQGEFGEIFMWLV
ncbi:Rad21/Rec8 N terminal domain-containing protein [Blastomyces gilchristii SLH14081]|uniref:Rad21/Rec8 N terminal domain-containing protein n=1 Tax=Blastomyces gilchristii (strain SLH14081) TaxID=559298 RepID=A0A179V411_BLAGS|nr:Rad21/Rec8 N terminal domain-containing protein [Blastomyces gilchristii SLH14081]OAT13332.1 Rad21/Rec8 N terminal domain-containing protein [Blastomyces gilchristii SLH14081]